MAPWLLRGQSSTPSALFRDLGFHPRHLPFIFCPLSLRLQNQPRMAKKTAELLGDKAEYLLNHQSKTISKDTLHLPGADFVDRIWSISDRNPQVLRSLQSMYSNGRLAN